MRCEQEGLVQTSLQDLEVLTISGRFQERRDAEERTPNPLRRPGS